MSLRRRLVVIGCLLVAVWVATALLIVITQRGLLISQVDDQLRALPPGAFSNLAPPPGSRPEAPRSDTGADSPFSTIIVGAVTTDGKTTALFTGQLTPDAPSPDLAAAVTQLAGRNGTTTIAAISGTSRFRARVIPQANSSGYLVAARSLDEVDDAVTRLERTLAITGLVLVLVAGLAYLWIERLGLRPIARVTEVALAITAGDRSRRVPPASAGTEAAQLGAAINIMLDERDASDERLRQFVADASHELRTPLTSVRGYLDLYQQGAFRKPGQLDDVIRRLSAEAQRMGGLVDDMLMLASLDEGRPLRLVPVTLNRLLYDAAQDARAIQSTREIDVAVPENEITLQADEALIAQLLGILVANALAHTPVSARVTLTAENQDNYVRIVVADTGPGMTPEVAEHVFDRFWRGTAGRQRKPTSNASGSAGLGLAIARSIVEQHLGTITLDTTPGIGSRFIIKLPRDLEIQDGVIRIAGQPRPGSTPGKTPT